MFFYSQDISLCSFIIKTFHYIVLQSIHFSKFSFTVKTFSQIAFNRHIKYKLTKAVQILKINSIYVNINVGHRLRQMGFQLAWLSIHTWAYGPSCIYCVYYYCCCNDSGRHSFYQTFTAHLINIPQPTVHTHTH